MPVLVACKFVGDRIKAEGLSGDIFLPIISQWELSVAMTTTALMESAPKHKSNFFPIPPMTHIQFDENWPTDLGDSIISLLKINPPSRARNSEDRSDLAWFRTRPRFYACPCSLQVWKRSDKINRVNGRFLLPWKPESWSNLSLNLMQSFSDPSDTPHNYGQLVSEIFKFKSVDDDDGRQKTTDDDDGRTMLYVHLVSLRLRWAKNTCN